MWGKQETWIGACVAAMALAVVGTLLFYMLNHSPKPPRLYLVDPQQNVGLAYTQSVPTLSGTALRQWSKEVVQKTYTFNFLNIDDQIYEARPYFTADGWTRFYATWKNSDIYKKVKDQRLSVSVTPTMEPIEVDAIETKKFSAWQYKIPAIITYTGDIPTTPSNVIITLTFVRVPTTESPFGLGVTQLLTEQGTVP
jgi:intracellular multiplication protein IcmL